MNVQIMFPVSLFTADADAGLREATRAKLGAWLSGDEARRDLVATPLESYLSTAASGRSVIEAAALTELGQMITQAATQFLQWYGVDGAQATISRSWVDVYEPGMQQNEHAHEGQVLTAVYYVEAPEGCGDLVFQDPVAARRAHRAFVGTNAPTPQSAQQMNFSPVEGRLMIFESWLPHAVSGNRSQGRRVALVADLRRSR